MRNALTLLLQYDEELKKYIDSHIINYNILDVIKQYKKDKNYTDSIICKRAGMDRGTYSNIILGKYKAGRNAIICIGLSFELNLKQFEYFMAIAGHCLSDVSKRDIIIKFCIEKEIYNIVDVNSLLFKHGCQLLTRNME
jgi:hypothetical protein